MSAGRRFPHHLYYDIPHVTAREYVGLAREMLRVRLDDMPAHVDSCADEIERLVDEAEAALEALGEHDDPQREAEEVEIERWTDKLAGMVQGSLGFWSFYQEPVINKTFSEEEKAELDFDTKREQAKRATAAHDGMFGEDGREFFELSYPQRFRALSAMLRSLSKDDLGTEVRELLHEPLRQGIDLLSENYERQIEEHVRVRDEARSLAKHRAALRWAIAIYVHEVRETADRWSKESCDRVNTAVQPLQDWCRRMSRRH